MIDASFRPNLRPIETIVVPDAKHGRVVVLRDTQGVTDAHAAIPPVLVPIVSRFGGGRTCAQIAKEASREVGSEIPVDVVIRLAEQLDAALFLESDTFRKARARVEKDFADADVRPASHAGGAYERDAKKLGAYIDGKCLAKAPRARGNKRPIVGLVAPHIDPWRGAVGYGHAYQELSRSIPDSVDTFVLLGTSHAPMREHFALCRKAFDTPFGAVPADFDAIDTLAKSARFDPYADQFNHKREHSLEFQVVFLKHVLHGRRFRIVPILASLGEHQARGTDPAKDDRANRFLEGLRDLVASRAGRVVVVAGADMAHVGPRFGDAQAYGASERADLEANDHASLARAAAMDARSFWSHVARDLDTRRVCGLAPIYTLLRALPDGAAGDLLHYEQTIDAEDGSIVSHAALAFHA